MGPVSPLRIREYEHRYKKEARKYFHPTEWYQMAPDTKETYGMALGIYYELKGIDPYDPIYPNQPMFMRLGKFTPGQERSLAIDAELLLAILEEMRKSEYSELYERILEEEAAKLISPNMSYTTDEFREFSRRFEEYTRSVEVEEMNLDQETHSFPHPMFESPEEDEREIRHHADFYNKEIQRLSREERARLGFGRKAGKLRHYAELLHTSTKGVRNELWRRGFFAISYLNPEELTILLRSVDFVESFVTTTVEEERRRKTDYIWLVAEMYARMDKLDDLVFLPWRQHEIYLQDDGIPVDPDNLDIGFHERPPEPLETIPLINRADNMREACGQQLENIKDVTNKVFKIFQNEQYVRRTFRSFGKNRVRESELAPFLKPTEQAAPTSSSGKGSKLTSIEKGAKSTPKGKASTFSGQASTSKSNPGQASTSKSNPGQASTSKSNPGQASTSKSNPGQASTSKSNPGQASTSKSNPGQASTSKSNPGQASTSKSKPGQASTSKSNPEQAEGSVHCELKFTLGEKLAEFIGTMSLTDVDEEKYVPSRPPMELIVELKKLREKAERRRAEEEARRVEAEKRREAEEARKLKAEKDPQKEQGDNIKGRRYPKRNIKKVDYEEPPLPNLDDYLYCDECHAICETPCLTHPRMFIYDKPVPEDSKDKSIDSCPDMVAIDLSAIPGAGHGAWSTKVIRANTVFGPYDGVCVADRVDENNNSGYLWEIKFQTEKVKSNKTSLARTHHYIDAGDPQNSNWMRYVNCSRNAFEENLVAFQYRGRLFYRVTKHIPPMTELLVNYGNDYCKRLLIDLSLYHDEKKKWKYMSFKCNTCDITFSSPLYVSKHAKYCRGKKGQPEVSSGNGDVNNNIMQRVEDRNEERRCAVPFCDYKSNNVKMFNAHMSEKHVGEQLYRCTECEEGFDFPRALTEHYEEHEKLNDSASSSIILLSATQSDGQNIKPYICEENSNDSTESPIVLSNCSSTQSDKQNIKPFQCEECGSSCTRSGDLKKHMRTHTGEKPFRCEECGSSFTQSGNLKNHMRTHTGEKPFRCEECGHSCTESGGLKKHMRIHTGEKPFRCEECGSSFTESGGLKYHMRTHTGEKPFRCEECGHSCTTSGGLKKHMRIHTGEKPFRCEECGSSFTESGGLKRHMRTHTGEKPFRCEECGHSCTTSGSLKNHMRTHTGEKPFRCEECGFSCTQSGSLKYHMRTHTGEKPFRCEECGHSCTTSGGLKYHMRTHTGEKPFRCEECGHSCTTSGGLKYHMRRKHPGV